MPVHVYGIVSRVGKMTNEVYCRQLRCICCNKKIWKVTDIDMEDTICCPNQYYEEHQPSRIIIPAQEIHITVVSLAKDRNPCEETEFAISLYEELAGVCKLGDLVEVFGTIKFQPSHQQKRTLGFSELELVCNNVVCVRNPWELKSPQWSHPSLHQKEEEELDLELPCRLLQGAVKNIHPALFLVGSLLSAVMLSTQRLETRRDQVHILVVNHGHDPYTKSMMNDVATVLSPTNSHLRCSEMTPRFFEVEKSHHQWQNFGTAVSARYLTMIRTGITILDFNQVSKHEKQSLSDVLSKSLCCPCPGAEFTIPVTSTLWALMENFPSSKTQQLDVSHHLSEEMCDLFDIVIPCAIQNDSQYDQMAIHRLLDASCASKTSNRKALWSILDKAYSMKRPPGLSRDAKVLLQKYYTFIRGQNAEHVRCVPVHVSESLLRLTMASAKLRLSTVIRDTPDATLAIKLTEETLLETGVYNQPSELLLDLDEVSRKTFSTFDQELSAMHEVIKKTLFVKTVDIEE
eukprot:g8949.t1